MYIDNDHIASTAAAASPPPLDADVPDRLATATFGMG